MFYLKVGKRKKYIESDNVFTRCPICGREFAVDIQNIIADGGDLYGTAIYCGEHSPALHETEPQETPRLTQRDRDIYEDGHDAGVRYAQERMKELAATL